MPATKVSPAPTELPRAPSAWPPSLLLHDCANHHASLSPEAGQSYSTICEPANAFGTAHRYTCAVAGAKAVAPPSPHVHNASCLRPTAIDVSAALLGLYLALVARDLELTPFPLFLPEDRPQHQNIPDAMSVSGVHRVSRFALASDLANRPTPREEHDVGLIRKFAQPFSPRLLDFDADLPGGLDLS